MNTRAFMASALFLAVSIGVPFGMAQDKSLKEQVRDFPPDLRQYNRNLVPEDFAPGGEPALTTQPAGIEGAAPSIFIRDVVISNTDHKLKNINRSSNGEPSIAINPKNPKEIDILAFTEGWGANAPIWHSTNGGAIWSLDLTIPNPPGLAEQGCPCDQDPDYGQNGNMSATFLDFDTTGINAFSGTTDNPALASNWNWLVSGGVTQRTNLQGVGNADQPWLLVNRDPNIATQDDVYVAYDNFDGAPDMRVAVAPGSDPPDFTIDNLAGFSQGEINPGQRLAVDHSNGAVYTLFQQCPTTVPNCNNLGADPKTIHWFLNRSTDGGKTWTLNGKTTGILVAKGQSTQPTPKFGTVNALLGGVNHLTVDPSNSDLYVVFGNRDRKTRNNRLSIVRLTSNGKGGLKIETPHFVTGQVQAALPSVAVAKNRKGTVGVLYMVFNEIDPKSKFPMYTAMLATSDDHGVTFTQNKLEKFLSPATDNGDQRQRVLGDYLQMKALGNTFYGVFPGNGAPFGRPFANIDPIFFKTTVTP
jgi:hypothetical protein